MVGKVARIITTAAALCGLLLASACSSPPDEIGGSADTIVPVDTVRDWVTYGDYLVNMTVLSESKVPPTQEETDRGEGTIGRKIKVSLSEPLWSRPTVAKGVKPPSELTTGGGFWSFHGDKLTKVRIDGRPWLEVGQTYLVVLFYVDPEYHVWPDKPKSEAKPEWGPLTTMAYGQVAGQRVSQRTVDVSAGAESAKSAVHGKTGAEVGSLLGTTSPDPKAVPFMKEDPALRAQHAATG